MLSNLVACTRKSKLIDLRMRSCNYVSVDMIE